MFVCGDEVDCYFFLWNLRLSTCGGANSWKSITMLFFFIQRNSFASASNKIIIEAMFCLCYPNYNPYAIRISDSSTSRKARIWRGRNEFSKFLELP